MKFVKDGPIIPNDLIQARDEGRAVFFCGAGVSKESAGICDFTELCERVAVTLQVQDESPVRTLMRQAKEINGLKLGSSLLSVDRIFGLLERDFYIKDIERAVAEALQPEAPGLAAHETLLKLATTPQDTVQLVTTNFDRLFSECNPDLNLIKPGNLPRIGEGEPLDGVVHLHGVVNRDYSGAENRFVLSSSQFGRAYLGEGWATDFFKAIVERYVVVFVGYSAEDAPVQYFLESLKFKESSSYQVYAFHDQATPDHWREKKITAIPYSSKNNFKELWDTLGAWARMVSEPEKWSREVLQLAARGPVGLTPYEREKVAGFVVTEKGARQFAAVNPPIEWICVFDKFRRYARPGYTDDLTEGKEVDPFERYSLASDIPPVRKKNNNDLNVPEAVWDIFDNELQLPAQNISQPSIHLNKAAQVSGSVEKIISWLAENVDDPAVIWWVVSKEDLHPWVKGTLKFEVRRKREQMDITLLESWYRIFEVWQSGKSERDYDSSIFELTSIIKERGWSKHLLHRWAEAIRPYFKAGHYTLRWAVPPVRESRPDGMVNFDVAYPRLSFKFSPPIEWLPYALSLLRNNLLLAEAWELEYGRYRVSHIGTMHPGKDDSTLVDGSDLKGWVYVFKSWFTSLIENNESAARKEFMSWAYEDSPIFDSFKLWCCSLPDFLSPDEAGESLLGISEESFWDNYKQRDLLIALKDRWGDLSNTHRSQLEKRLLAGEDKWEGIDEKDFEIGWAAGILERIHWLYSRGCRFSFDLDEETKKLKYSCPDWTFKHSERADRSWGMKVSSYSTDLDFSCLANIQLVEVLSRAKEYSVEDWENKVQKRPFKGLCQNRPVRALSALRAAADSEDAAWGWNEFLNSCGEVKSKERFAILVALRLCELPVELLGKVLYHVSSWFSGNSVILREQNNDVYLKLFNVLLQAIEGQEGKEDLAVDSDAESKDWSSRLWNSPVRHILESLESDPRLRDKSCTAENLKDWFALLERVLNLPGTGKLYAINHLTGNLDWYYRIDPTWTEINLLYVFEEDTQNTKDAFWSGFLRGNYLTDESLFERIKPSLLHFTENFRGKVGYYGYSLLPELLLNSWAGEAVDYHNLISDDEMRKVFVNCGDGLRCEILNRIKWLSKSSKSIQRENWGALQAEFVRRTWPKEKTVRTPEVQKGLFKLLFSSPDFFVEKAEAILPHLESIPSIDMYAVGHFISDCPDTFDDYKLVLDVLMEILPDNPNDNRRVSYEMKEIIPRLESAGLADDERIEQLKQRYNL
ncbi:SIR2 family protein [Desulfovibrio sp. JC022]|uniref:SIR2 family protein n=1 Tax=Desulfovibrio sp. JC022 TaxID=2593642 RepID=UPI0013D6B772|nr:SIR2 family protein [Desulfovibrio sp. JC022]NDV21349.1 hypothetical protein [Desulfovibrio sp. JC022]